MDTDSGTIFYSLTIAEWEILGDLLAFFITGRFLRHSAKWRNADKIMNPQHFGSDPADIRARIRIDPEIWIRIPDHFWLRLDALAEVCALWAQSSY